MGGPPAGIQTTEMKILLTMAEAEMLKESWPTKWAGQLKFQSLPGLFGKAYYKIGHILTSSWSINAIQG